MNFPTPLNSGSIALCVVFSIALSNTRMSDGSIVTHAITPSTTPFAMTIPRSSPRVKLMKHSATNPATVVMELPTTDDIVSAMACAIASFLSVYSFCCAL